MTAATNSFGACTDIVTALSESQLLPNGQLRRVEEFLRASPDSEPQALLDFLVKKGVLTCFQADMARREGVRQLLLAHFVLTDVIGTGSMGSVYRARSIKDAGHYAVKIVPRRNVVNLNTVAEKVKAFKEIRHPRVSALVHIGASGDQVYLVWPLLEGGEKLDAAVRKQGKLSPRQAVQIGLQVASGLQAYHQHGLYHGLIKPSDIVIGSDRRVRILDFGVGFLLACERGRSLLDTMTNSKALDRGLDCANPESIMNPLDRSPAGDQYSLGCILYFCLAGRYPFPRDNPVKKMLAHQFEEPEPIRALNPEVSPRLEAILQRMMRKKPQERFASTDEVVQALQALSPNAKSHATPPANIAAVPDNAARPDSWEPPEPEVATAKKPKQRYDVNRLVIVGVGLGCLVGGLLALLLTRL